MRLERWAVPRPPRRGGSAVSRWWVHGGVPLRGEWGSLHSPSAVPREASGLRGRGVQGWWIWCGLFVGAPPGRLGWGIWCVRRSFASVGDRGSGTAGPRGANGVAGFGGPGRLQGCLWGAGVGRHSEGLGLKCPGVFAALLRGWVRGQWVGAEAARGYYGAGARCGGNAAWAFPGWARGDEGPSGVGRGLRRGAR